MTGTPVDNRRKIFGHRFFLDSGKSLGRSFSTFKDKYDLKELSESSLTQLEYKKNLEELREKLSDFSLEKLKKQQK